jgi:Domain of unknown function (DUF1877)
MTLGRHFALKLEDEKLLREIPDAERAEWIGNEVEERYTEPWICDSDKAWDAIHRAFGNSILDYEASTPLRGVILGGEPLYFETDYIISYKSPGYVKQIAAVLKNLTVEQFRERYFSIDEAEYGQPLDEEDFLYSWHWLEGIKTFYNTVADVNRSVIFTASQ